MAIHLQDQWYRRSQSTGAIVRTAHYGQRPRYRGHFSGDGTRKTKTFHDRSEAERWLVMTEVAYLLKGDA
ncbi:hypothetical protein OG866_12330 [Streptomyces sp. NBC_00663]|uniref:hypothetical protein n=1 Tax=Streptomyces sp. NBC_00663 TaxID=2975801 RepID=UPI002E344405|nr:hypothetical protein [Streptomyces sp. NBC_00663]